MVISSFIYLTERSFDFIIFICITFDAFGTQFLPKITYIHCTTKKKITYYTHGILILLKKINIINCQENCIYEFIIKTNKRIIVTSFNVMSKNEIFFYITIVHNNFRVLFY